MTDDFDKLIVDYAAKDCANLAMSVRISRVFNDIKRKVILDFVSRLTKELRARYRVDSWEIASSGDTLERFYELTIRNKKWAGKHWIGMEAGSAGPKNFCIGVAKGGQTKKTVDGLKADLDKRFGGGKQTDWWEWYRDLDRPFRDWDNEEGLCAMLSGEAVANFLATSKLLEIIETADPMLR